jgi:capsular exopolysaccharide synthesis family protein
MTPDQHGAQGGTGPREGKYQPFNVANLLRAQQRLLTSGARGPGPGTDARGPVPDGHGDRDRQFGLQDYLDLLGRRWICVAIPFVVVTALAFVYASFEPSEHQATSRLLITRSLFGQRIADDLIEDNIYVSSTALHQMAKLESVRRLAAKSINDWAVGRESVLDGLWSAPAPAPPADGAPPAPARVDPRWRREDLATEERRRLASFADTFALVSGGVRVHPDTQNVAVTITAADGSEIVAAAAADGLAAAIVESFNRRRWDGSSLKLIEDQLRANEVELADVDRKVADLRNEVPGGEAALEGFPLEIERQFDLLREHTAGLRSVSSMIEEAAEKISILDAQSARAGEAPPEDMVKGLIDLELEREQLSSRYTEAHPRMRKLAEEIQHTRRLIDEYPKRRRELGAHAARPYGYYDPDVQLAFEKSRRAGLAARKKQLERSIAAIRREMETDAHGRSARYRQLVMKRDALQDYAKALRMRLQRAKLAERRRSERTGGAIEAEPAETSMVGPRLWQTVVLGGIVGLMAGLLLAFLAERLDDSIRTPAEMRFLAGVSTLQVVPLFRRSLVIRPEETVSGIANVFAVLRNNIRYSAQNVPESSILVTSAVAGEGKSLVAVNLAVSFAQEGSRTCLVDADVQKGEHHAMEVAVKLAWEPSAGLATYLEGSAELEHVVVPSVELPHLAFVGSGGRAANPPRALRGDRAAEFFSRLQEEYDVMIVDSPPVLPVVDAAILAAHCRSVVHVVRYGYTRRGELEEAARRLRHVNAPLVGLVLNCARVGAGGYGYRRYTQPARAT